MSTPFYDLASLVVVPSGYKASKVYAQKPLTTDGQLTFSRASTATRVNSAGLIETVSSNVPRLDYLNSSCPRLLLEPQRTNLVTYSEQLNTGSGGTSAVTANTQVSPDGYTNADTIGAGYWTKSTSQAAGTYTLSVFAKYQSAASILLYIYDGAYYQGSFNLQTGVATSSTGSPSVSMVSYGNGWYRCIVTATAASTISEVGFGSGNFYGYGLQLEAGAYATSYIPTLGAAVTRGADTASKTGISSLIGQTEGTIFWELNVKIPSATGLEAIVNIDNGSGFGNTMYIYHSPAAQIVAETYVSGASQSSFTRGSITAGVYKCALAYANNNTAFFVNGVQVGSTDTSCSVPATSRIQMGQTALSSDTSWTKQLLLFKTRLTNAQLAELTTL